MHPVAHGIDLVSIRRIERLLERHRDRFLARCFTPAEQAYAAGSRREAEHLAVRFAAKEAVLKAIGTGWSGGIEWTDVEVVRHASGAPGIRLAGRALRAARAAGIASWLVSLTHTADAAGASVIGLASDRVPTD